MRELFTDFRFYVVLVMALLTGMALAARIVFSVPGGYRLKVFITLLTIVFGTVVLGRHPLGPALVGLLATVACATVGAAIVMGARRSRERFILGRWYV